MILLGIVTLIRLSQLMQGILSPPRLPESVAHSNMNLLKNLTAWALQLQLNIELLTRPNWAIFHYSHRLVEFLLKRFLGNFGFSLPASYPTNV
jgi:hypothetical protein